MKCLRCGYCCTNYCVIIVDDPVKGIKEDNLICHEGNGPCKHLIGDCPGKFSCALHSYPWYKETPCFAFTQLPENDSNCRMGEYILKKKKDARTEEDKR